MGKGFGFRNFKKFRIGLNSNFDIFMKLWVEVHFNLGFKYFRIGDFKLRFMETDSYFGSLNLKYSGSYRIWILPFERNLILIWFSFAVRCWSGSGRDVAGQFNEIWSWSCGGRESAWEGNNKRVLKMERLIEKSLVIWKYNNNLGFCCSGLQTIAMRIWDLKYNN